MGFLNSFCRLIRRMIILDFFYEFLFGPRRNNSDSTHSDIYHTDYDSDCHLPFSSGYDPLYDSDHFQDHMNYPDDLLGYSDDLDTYHHQNDIDFLEDRTDTMDWDDFDDPDPFDSDFDCDDW